MARRLRLLGLREQERGPAQAAALRPPVPRLQEADLGGGRDVHAPLARAAEELASGYPHHDFAFERDVGLAAAAPSGFGELKVAWTLVHKIRRAMDAADGFPLIMNVQADETGIPYRLKGSEPPPGGRSHEGRLMIAGAVEVFGENSPGCVKLRRITDQSGPTLKAFRSCFKSSENAFAVMASRFRYQPSLAGKDDTMTGMRRSKLAEFKSELECGGDAVRELLRGMLQEILEEEMTEALGAAKGERTSDRLGYRSGYCKRHLTTRVGQVELRVPQDRNGAFSTELFERYERSEKAFVSALMQMYVHGVSTRKVAKVTEALCGHGFSASTISRLNAKLDAELGKFAERRLEGSFPYLILDARYEKVREDGVVRDRAVLIAVGVDASGRRQVLGVELAEGESHASWRRFLESLRDRGLCGVVQIVSDDHSGLTKAIREVVPEAVLRPFPAERPGPFELAFGRRLPQGASLDL